MKFYELAYLISPELSEEELNSLKEKISSLIQEEGGVLNGVNLPVRKRLAYPIKKQKEAFFITLNFSLEAEKLGVLEKKLKSEEKVLRYLILAKKLPRKVAAPIKPPKPIKARPKTKVELKDIEKKLEEILEE